MPTSDITGIMIWSDDNDEGQADEVREMAGKLIDLINDHSPFNAELTPRAGQPGAPKPRLVSDDG